MGELVDALEEDERDYEERRVWVAGGLLLADLYKNYCHTSSIIWG